MDDDHIDDFFIKNYLSNATCIIPKLQLKVLTEE